MKMQKGLGVTKEIKNGYFLSGSVYMLCFLCWSTLAILWLYEPDASDKDIFYLFVFLINIPITLIASIGNFYNHRHEKIILNENGITYKAFGVRIFTAWNRLNHIEESRGLLHNEAKGRLYKSEYIPVRKEDVSRKFYAYVVNYRNVIPLSNFGKEWRDSSLGEFLKEKVPYIFNVQEFN